MSLLSMKDWSQIIDGAAAAAASISAPHSCRFTLQVEVQSSWSLTSLVTGDSKGLTLLLFS